MTRLLESSTELIRTLEQVNMSLREGKSLEVSLRTLEAINGLKTQLESLLQGRKWRNTVERIWAFGPRRSDIDYSDMGMVHIQFYLYLPQWQNQEPGLYLGLCSCFYKLLESCFS